MIVIKDQHNVQTGQIFKLTLETFLQVGCSTNGIDEAVARLTAAGYKVRTFKSKSRVSISTSNFHIPCN